MQDNKQLLTGQLDSIERWAEFERKSLRSWRELPVLLSLVVALGALISVPAAAVTAAIVFPAVGLGLTLSDRSHRPGLQKAVENEYPNEELYDYKDSGPLPDPLVKWLKQYQYAKGTQASLIITGIIAGASALGMYLQWGAVGLITFVIMLPIGGIAALFLSVPVYLIFFLVIELLDSWLYEDETY